MVYLLDHRIEIATPEGASIELAPAGPFVRMAAFSIDLLIRGLILFVTNIGFSLAEKFGTGLFLISFFLIEWFYPVLFELFRAGQTPGKKAMSIAVVQADGTPVCFSNSLLRNLLRAVDFLPVGYLLGLATMVFSQSFQRLGDILANTLVIYQHSQKSLQSIENNLAPTYLTTPLTESEQKAIIQFSIRAETLSSQRRGELANLLYPSLLTNSEQAENELMSIASGLMGQEEHQ